jgi:hypothetical protein
MILAREGTAESGATVRPARRVCQNVSAAVTVAGERRFPHFASSCQAMANVGGLMLSGFLPLERASDARNALRPIAPVGAWRRTCDEHGASRWSRRRTCRHVAGAARRGSPAQARGSVRTSLSVGSTIATTTRSSVFEIGITR